MTKQELKKLVKQIICEALYKGGVSNETFSTEINPVEHGVPEIIYRRADIIASTKNPIGNAIPRTNNYNKRLKIPIYAVYDDKKKPGNYIVLVQGLDQTGVFKCYNKDEIHLF